MQHDKKVELRSKHWKRICPRMVLTVRYHILLLASPTDLG